VQRLIAEKGLQGKVQVELRDYRQMGDVEPFDKIGSVGMFEHVGSANLQEYFETIYSMLRPGGLALVHGITAGGVSNVELGAGMGEFINRYIFPGGELMHVSRVLHDLAASGLEMVDTENLRPHYARTLWAWSDTLESRLGEAQAILQAQYDEKSRQGAACLPPLSGGIGHGLRAWLDCAASDALLQTRWRSAQRRDDRCAERLSF
jgi:cyclopropane-fatty-acyl-phospholipid synthase